MVSVRVREWKCTLGRLRVCPIDRSGIHGSTPAFITAQGLRRPVYVSAHSEYLRFGPLVTLETGAPRLRSLPKDPLSLETSSESRCVSVLDFLTKTLFRGKGVG